MRNVTAQCNRSKVQGLTDLAIAHSVDAVERGRLHARLRQERRGHRVKTRNLGRSVAPRTRAQAPNHKSGARRKTEPPAKSWAVSLGILGKCILGKPMSMFMDGNCAASTSLRSILKREQGWCAERRTHGGQVVGGITAPRARLQPTQSRRTRGTHPEHCVERRGEEK